MPVEPVSFILSLTGTILAVLMVNRLERRRRGIMLDPRPRGLKRNKCRAMFGKEPLDYKQPVPQDRDNPFYNQVRFGEHAELVM
ncbi:hypothetical protein LTR12_012078 [Friedmanniomyces endolithicus]|nr:hypothetical protein LTR74_009190 [Friedmanniomyces endolithicus]KAK1813509.1 hypothetical protein LTR12_012078 [Friedmanniomyces endolithicus]